MVQGPLAPKPSTHGGQWRPRRCHHAPGALRGPIVAHPPSGASWLNLLPFAPAPVASYGFRHLWSRAAQAREWALRLACAEHGRRAHGCPRRWLAGNMRPLANQPVTNRCCSCSRPRTLQAHHHSSFIVDGGCAGGGKAEGVGVCGTCACVACRLRSTCTHALGKHAKPSASLSMPILIVTPILDARHPSPSGMRGCLYMADNAPVNISNVEFTKCGMHISRTNGKMLFIKDTRVSMQGALTQGSCLGSMRLTSLGAADLPVHLLRGQLRRGASCTVGL